MRPGAANPKRRVHIAVRTKQEHYPGPSSMGNSDACRSRKAAAARFEAATDQAIAACGGDARDAVKALIVANWNRKSAN